MRVFKKISTPFIKAKPDAAIIVINALDPQLNTIRAFIKACHDYDLAYILCLNKIDVCKKYEEEVKRIKKELDLRVLPAVSAKEKINIDILENYIMAWKGKRTIFLGVFNSGKTSLINDICKTNYRVADIPGTTLKFTETKYKDNIVIIDSVGQLIDITKPLMISIDFSGCVNRDEKINKVFDEEIFGLATTKELCVKQIYPIIDVIKERLSKGNKIIVTGAGASALVAKEIAGQGTECGFPVMVFTNDGAECQPITFSKGIAEAEEGLSRYISHAINKGDVIVGVSASGGTGFVFDVLKKAKEKEALTIAITENIDTPLGKYADYIIKSDAKPEGPSSSKIQTAHLVIGHTLMLVLADEAGVTADASVGFMLPENLDNKAMGIK